MFSVAPESIVYNTLHDYAGEPPDTAGRIFWWSRAKTMIVTIASIDFDHHRYDKRGDVLYLNVGAPRPAARSLEVEDGHTVHYDESDAVIGLTLLNIKHTLDTSGYVKLTVPVVHLIGADELREVLGLSSSKADVDPQSPAANSELRDANPVR